MITFTAPDGYDRSKTPRKLTLRYLTLAEVKALSGHADIIANDGRVRRVKITSVKTWKTRPDDVLVGVKYGLYEYASFSAAESVTRFVREV
jgi:hypothetical protein